MNPRDFTEEELEAGREPVNVPEMLLGLFLLGVVGVLLWLLAGGSWPT